MEREADRRSRGILTGPVASAPYFEQIDRFIRLTLGDAAAGRYEIIVGDPQRFQRSLIRSSLRGILNAMEACPPQARAIGARFAA